MGPSRDSGFLLQIVQAPLSQFKSVRISLVCATPVHTLQATVCTEFILHTFLVHMLVPFLFLTI